MYVYDIVYTVHYMVDTKKKLPSIINSKLGASVYPQNLKGTNLMGKKNNITLFRILCI